MIALFRVFFALTLLCGCAHCSFVGIYKMTFAAAEPVAAQTFVMRYFNATAMQQPHEGGNGRCAMIKWIGFPGSHGAVSNMYQFHFVKGYHRPNGTMTIDQWAETTHCEVDMAARSAGTLPDTDWSIWLDRSVGISVDSLDPIVQALQHDATPFFLRKLSNATQPIGGTRSEGHGRTLFSLFVEVPGSLFLEVFSWTLSPGLVSHVPEWDVCARRKRISIVSQLIGQSGELTSVVQPVQATYASSYPNQLADFMKRYLDMEDVPGGADIPHSECSVTMRWLRFPRKSKSLNVPPEYQIHVVGDPNATVVSDKCKNSLTLKQYESYLTALHGNISGPGEMYDEYMDFHIGIAVDDMDPYIKRLREDGIPFFTRGQYGSFVDVFIEGPGGVILEMLAPKQSVLQPGEIEQWDLCGPLSSHN